MKIYPLGAPPPKAGIYLIRNTVTGMLYVGRSMNLRRRFSEWRMSVVQKFNIRSFKFVQALESGSSEDWEFGIIAEFDAITDDELAEYEYKAVARLASKFPNRLLNTITPSQPSKAINVAKSTILYEGRPVSYAEAANKLGCSSKQLQKRMARYRKKGVDTVELEKLLDLTQVYRGGARAMLAS